MSNPSPRKGIHPVEPGASAQPIASSSLDDPRLYINRDMSFLEFERRVMEEAMDESTPLLERVKFLSILGSNLDEFDMVRVSAVKRLVENEVAELDAGVPPSVLLDRVWETLRLLMVEARKHLNEKIIPALAAAGIWLLNYSDLSLPERSAVEAYFTETVLPLLTPMAFDSRRPFVQTSNLSLSLAVLVRDGQGEERFAQLEVPQTIPQFVPVRVRKGRAGNVQKADQSYLLLEQVISANLNAVFQDMEIVQVYPFRVTRDAEIYVREAEASDLLDRIQHEVSRRKFGSVNRLGVASEMPEHMVDLLINNLKAIRGDMYRAIHPLALSRFIELSKIERPDLLDPPLQPRIPAALAGSNDIFASIRKNDILLHHPYDSFQPVLDFIQQSATDPDVLAIKITLYRVGREPPIVDALIDASRSGKKVTAVVELKARFDEESNIKWARALEDAGVHVVYGIAGLKVHCKIALVVRREAGMFRRYVHIGTGNYNPAIAKVYTDLGLLSCEANLGVDVTDLFNYFTGYSGQTSFRKLLVGPMTLRGGISAMIRRETDRGDSGRLIFKMNALLDEDMIRLLYQASQAGVKVDLIVRGVCALRPGVPGISENIRVRSIVGRFLEHGRIYYFGNGGREEIYIGSADLRSRNLNRRVEVICPIQDELLKIRLRDEILGTLLADNVKARFLMSDGSYQRATRSQSEPAISCQQALLL